MMMLPPTRKVSASTGAGVAVHRGVVDMGHGTRASHPPFPNPSSSTSTSAARRTPGRIARALRPKRNVDHGPRRRHGMGGRACQVRFRESDVAGIANALDRPRRTLFFRRSHDVARVARRDVQGRSTIDGTRRTTKSTYYEENGGYVELSVIGTGNGSHPGQTFSLVAIVL